VVRGLFPKAEQRTVLDLVMDSVVFSIRASAQRPQGGELVAHGVDHVVEGAVAVISSLVFFGRGTSCEACPKVRRGRGLYSIYLVIPT
jgi:hypothetical protein